MNLLQQFMTAAQTQARPVIREAFTVDGVVGQSFFGTFGDPIPVAVQTRNGYENRNVTTLIADGSTALATALTPSASVGRVTVTRTQTGAKYLVTVADIKDPVAFTVTLNDRDVV